MFQREIMLSRRSVVMIILLIAFSSALYELIEIKTMALVGIFTVALFCSDIATKFLFNLLPRSFIDNCNDKAVLITGIYHYSTFLFHIHHLLLTSIKCNLAGKVAILDSEIYWHAN